jgi:serine/threonine protein kinase
MRKPPDDDRGPTWGAGALITGTPYGVLRELGRGGMSTVYEVRHVDTGLVYAFKVLSTRVAEHPELVERVEREAAFLHLLDGAPHIVTVVDWGRLPGEHRRPYLVMERLYGETLAALLARHALPLTDALSYVRQVLWGVAAVHGVGAIHRDIKPSNIFVRRDGTCTLLDFGIMKMLSDIGLPPGQFTTAEGVPIGTPFYMAPEQASCATVDCRADIFSVGLVLAECLLGFRLLPQLSERAYLERLINEGVPSLEVSGGEHLPVEVRKLVRCATRFDPEKRFPSAQAFILAINRIAEALGLRLRPIPPSVPRAPGAPPPRAPGDHAAPTPNAYDSKAPTPRVYRAPAPLAPSRREAPPKGPAAESATPPTNSAQPTPVDSISPTQVKTPSPQSGLDSTLPLRSQRRKPFGVLTLGWGGRAPKKTSPQGNGREPPPTLPLPPTSAVSFPASKFHDRLALLKGMPITPGNDVLERSASTEAPPALESWAEAQPALESSVEAQPVLESSAEAQPVLMPSTEAQLPEGALPVASARPRRSPLVSAVMLWAAGAAAGVVVSLAAVFWADPSARVHVSFEPRRASPAGVVAPAVTPAPEPSAEPKPPEVASPATPPPNAGPGTSAAPERQTAAEKSVLEAKRAALEAKLRDGKGKLGEVRSLNHVCRQLGDEACQKRAYDYFDKLIEVSP